MKTILLVEDDPFIVDIYANQLKKEGYRVDVAMDGQAALNKIRSQKPDLLVLDIGLPKMDGWEVLRLVRSDAKTENVKTIVISNNSPKDYEDHIAKLKVIKYFLKVEATPEEIIKTVNEILN